MDVMTAIKNRRSIRVYKSTEVEKEKLQLMLEAAELGIGTCWLGSFYEDKVKEVLNLPEGYRVVAMTPLGYPGENPTSRPRKSMEEIVEYI